MVQKTDTRQLRYNDSGVSPDLDQVTTTVDKQLDNLLRSINSELTQPLRLTPNSTPNLIVNVGNITVTNPETSRSRTVPPISNTTPAFTTGTITFPAATGGNIVPSSGATVALVCPSGQFTRVGISLNAAGQLTITQGTAGASFAAATAAPIPSNTLPIGFIAVHNTGGTIDNITNAMIYTFGSGGGAGSSGSGNETLETIKNMFVDSPFDLVTPWTASSDADLIGGATGFTYTGSAVFSLADQAIKFTAATETATTVQLLDSTEFLASGLDVGSVDLLAEWKAGSIDTAATYALSRDGGGHYSTVTMERVGLGTNLYRGLYQWVREEEDAIASNQFVTTTNTLELTNAAGVNESLASKVVLANTTRVTGITAYLSKTGSPTGNYRIALYNDNAGVPGSIVTAGAFTAATGITGSAVAYTAVTDVTVPAGTYYIAVETDATYKGIYVAATTTLLQHGITSAGTNLAFRQDGGVWAAIASTTLAYVAAGFQEAFDDQNANGAGYAVANATIQTDNLDDGTARAYLSQAFTTTAAITVKQVQLYLNKIQSAGTVAGNLFLAIYSDNAGSPSTTVLGESSAVAISGISTGNQAVVFDIPNLPLAIGTYHLVLRSDAAYKASYSSTVREIDWRSDNTSPPIAGKRSLDAITWTSITNNFVHRIDGRKLDLRIRVTASAGNKFLTALAAFYNLTAGQVASGVKKRQVFRFNGNTENLSSFAVTNFQVDSELLKVYWVEGGQAFVYPAFNTQGQTVAFATNTFYSPVSNTVTLVMDQNDGSSFDNSDLNAKLMAANHLGSTDSNIDKSVAGRGIILRRPDGTLRELVINNGDGIDILSVP